MNSPPGARCDSSPLCAVSSLGLSLPSHTMQAQRAGARTRFKAIEGGKQAAAGSHSPLHMHCQSFLWGNSPASSYPAPPLRPPLSIHCHAALDRGKHLSDLPPFSPTSPEAALGSAAQGPPARPSSPAARCILASRSSKHWSFYSSHAGLRLGAAAASWSSPLCLFRRLATLACVAEQSQFLGIQMHPFLL